MKNREKRAAAPAKKRKRFWKHKDVNNGEKSFAAGLNVYKIIWVFAVGCLFGVIFETLYVYLMTGEWFRTSGMLYGPFNQVYGLGAVLFTVVLYRYRHHNALAIFFASFVMGLVFEYVASWVQELLFGSVSWEYSDMPFNIGGRTNLLYGVGWGVLGLLFITHAWPFLSEFIERIPNTVGKTLSLVIAVFLALNMLLSALAVGRWQSRQQGVEANNFISTWLDKTYPDSYMQKAYPRLEFVDEDGNAEEKS